MTTELFEGNTFILYLLFVLSVIIIDKFNERQKMAVIYLCTYGMSFQEKASCIQLCILLAIMMFAIQEYFTLDRKKLSIFHKLHYKLADFLYMSIFQYKIWLVIFALVLRDRMWMDAGWMTESLGIIFFLLSVTLFIAALIWMFNVPEVFYSISHIYEEVWNFPYYNVNFDSDLLWRLYIITEFEDDLIWDRKKAYTTASLEYVRVWYRNRYLSGEESEKEVDVQRGRVRMRDILLFCKRMKGHLHGVLRRGHSTIPMQLIRNLSYRHGLVFNSTKNVRFKKYKLFKRKVYEWIYARMFFEGLKNYLKTELGNDLLDYKAYLIYLYPHIVQCTIDGITYAPAMKAFRDDEGKVLPMHEWDIEKVYKMAYGFNGETITEKKIAEKRKRVEERRGFKE